MPSMNLVFAGHRCCDHSPNSGYDQVCTVFPEAGWLDGRALEAGRIEWLREPRGAVASAVQVFHVFYGDCSGKRLPAILRERFPGCAIISSAHQPVSRLQADQPAWSALEMSDAIITVSELQARELAHAGSPAPVYAIPHGVWTKPFRPLGALSGACRKQVLLVGSFLRDWDGAKHIVGELARAGVRSIAVGAGARDHLAGGDATVEVLPRVSEEELAQLYDSSAAVLLPFLEATASNALLEAMAAGCPIVCPRFPSLIDEYLGDDSDAFERGRYDTAVARLLHYVRNPEQRTTKSQTLMARADQFDWSRLAPRYQAAYIAVAHGRVPGDSRSLVDRAVRA